VDGNRSFSPAEAALQFPERRSLPQTRQGVVFPAFVENGHSIHAGTTVARIQVRNACRMLLFSHRGRRQTLSHRFAEMLQP